MARRFEDKFSWEHAIVESDLPAMTRHILLTMSVRMDKAGGSCFPTIDELAAMTGLARNTVLKHRAIAIEQGWLVTSNMGFGGRKWRRAQYVAAIPGTTRCGVSNNEGGAGDAPPSPAKAVQEMHHVTKEGGAGDAPEAVQEMHHVREQTNKQTRERERAGGKNRKSDCSAVVSADQDVGSEKSADDPKKFEDRVKRLGSGHGFGEGEWKGWLGSSVGYITGQFARLTDAERADAERHRDAYLAHCAAGRIKPAPLGLYLKDRKWTSLPDEAVRRAERAVTNAARREQPDDYAPAYGPVWSAWRIGQLIAGPENPDAELPQTPLAIHFRAAWPRLAQVEALANSGRRGVRLGERWHALKPAMEAVPADSALAGAWESVFRARRWPWLAPAGMKVIYLPAGGPDRLDAFAAMIGRSPEPATQPEEARP